MTDEQLGDVIDGLAATRAATRAARADAIDAVIIEDNDVVYCDSNNGKGTLDYNGIGED